MQNQIPQLSSSTIQQSPENSSIKITNGILLDNTSSKTLINKSINEEKIILDYVDRFIWNSHILQPLLKATNNIGLIIPIINGCVTQKNIEMEGRNISIIIISRRSRFFAGPRYLKRGINSFGDVANEVETEQILFEGSQFDNTLFKISSFIHVKIIFKKSNYFYISIEVQCRFIGDMKIYIHQNPQLLLLKI